MASIERTAYPRFKPALSTQELYTLYYPTDDERDFARAHTRRATGELMLLALLKTHQYLGYLPPYDEIPLQIRRYLCQQLNLPPTISLAFLLFVVSGIDLSRDTLFSQ
jgi:hypothetical protein